MADVTLETLDAHLTQLCEQNGIDRELSSRRGKAVRWRNSTRRAIRIPPVKGQIGYFVGCHELGHLLGPGRSAPRLEAEANAWLWALENAIVEPTPATRQRIGARLHGYLLWAQNRQYRKIPPRIPADTHPFWVLHAWHEQ